MKFFLKYKYVIMAFLFGSFFIPNILNAENYLDNKTSSLVKEKPSEDIRYSKYDYVIDKYDVNIIVNENNTFDITETITAYFNVPKHGIYRIIPLKNTITRLDGTSSSNRAQLYNLSINNKYKKSKINNNYEIKIGSTNKTFIGEQTYVIKYTYNIGKDPLVNMDELYFNIIGNDWDTVIGNITFKIIMPKEFDKTKLGFSSGRKGLIDNSLVEYNMNGLVITGKYNGLLDKNEALTIRCELDEGYFVNAGLKLTLLNYLQIIIPLISLIIAILLWNKYGKNNKIIDMVEFYPPEELNSLELAKVYKGYVYNKDIVSLLICLANKGYIEIIDNKDKKYLIKKIKSYDGNNKYERLFMEGLFKYNRTEVTEKMLKNKFYRTINLIKDLINDDYKDKIYENNSKKEYHIALLVILSIISYFLAVLPIIIKPGFTMEVLFFFLMSTFSFVIMFTILFALKNEELGKRLPTIITFLFLGVVPLSILFPHSLENKLYMYTFILGTLCVVGIIYCIVHLQKRTEDNNKMLGRIKGFKKFLTTAEKEKLKKLVEKNPQYFYDVLPFTYVLGISNKWIKKFEGISMSPPTWYNSNEQFNNKRFNKYITNTIRSFKDVMSSSPNNYKGKGYSSYGGSSSFSSGGGSSGGGSGGGGGGSW